MDYSISTVKFSKKDNYRAKISSDSEKILGFIKSKFTINNPNERFSQFSPKTLSCISPFNFVEYGLVLDIIKNIKFFDSSIKIEFDDFTKSKVFPLSYIKDRNIDLINPENLKYKYRDYQEESIKKSLNFGKGLIDLCTSAGKSLVQYGLILNLWEIFKNKETILVVVPNIQLVVQLKKDFIEYGCDEELVSQFSAFQPKKELLSNIIISNKQWLNFHSKELPKNIKVLFVDECHGLSGKNSKLTRYIRHLSVSIRFGFSGTLPVENDKLWNIIGLLGPRLIRRSAKELQKLNYISQIRIVSIHFKHSKKSHKLIKPPTTKIIKGKTIELSILDQAKLKYPLEFHFCEQCDFTNSFVTKFIFNLKNNSILLYDHNIHGEILIDLFNNLNSNNSKKIFLINGDTPLDYREEIREQMEKDSNIILVANTACFKMGINIKNIYNICFAFSSGNAAPKIIQSIGRGLRKLKDKTHMTLYDFYHNFNYSNSHYSKRLKLYKENYDYGVKIIKKFIEVV